MSGLGGAAVYQRTEFGNICMTAYGRYDTMAIELELSLLCSATITVSEPDTVIVAEQLLTTVPFNAVH